MAHRQIAGGVDGQRAFSDTALVADERQHRAGRLATRRARLKHAIEELPHFGARQRTPQEILHVGAQDFDDGGAFGLFGAEGQRGGADSCIRRVFPCP